MADRMKLSCLVSLFVVCLNIGALWGACPQIISRAEWGARDPTSISYMTLPLRFNIIHHSNSANCMDRNSCIAEVQYLQNYNMDTMGYVDVGYSFVIGGDGSVFEGRGWDRLPLTNTGMGSLAYGIMLLGNFMTELPPQAQMNAAKDLMDCGVTLGKLTADYIIRGHRDQGPTTCPGDMLYAEIQTWAHYS